MAMLIMAQMRMMMVMMMVMIMMMMLLIMMMMLMENFSADYDTDDDDHDHDEVYDDDNDDDDDDDGGVLVTGSAPSRGAGPGAVTSSLSFGVVTREQQVKCFVKLKILGIFGWQKSNRLNYYLRYIHLICSASI